MCSAYKYVFSLMFFYFVYDNNQINYHTPAVD